MKFDWPGNENNRRNITHLFLAEGAAEVGLLNSLLLGQGADRDKVGVYCFKGLARFATTIPSLTKTLNLGLESVSQLDGIGIIADSEADPTGRLESVISFFKKFGFPHCARDLLANGQHISGHRRVAVSFSPNLNDAGKIEDLVLQEIAESNEFRCIDEYLKCAGDCEDFKKAAAQIFISTRRPDLCGLGRAFEAGIFSANNKAYGVHLQMVNYILSASAVVR